MTQEKKEDSCMRNVYLSTMGEYDEAGGITRHFLFSFSHQLFVKVKERVGLVLMNVSLSLWYNERHKLPPGS